MNASTRAVLMVHGLGRTPASLLFLARRLRREGYRAELFGYYAFVESHPWIVGRLAQQLRRLAREGKPVGLVGHSLGGLLLRQAVALVPELEVRSLIMLGTPNQAPRLARRVRHWRAFRLLARSCGEFLATPTAISGLPTPAYPYTLIAGNNGWQGRLSPFGDEPNDGFVAVGETRITPTDKPVILPVAHTFMMNHRAVQDAVLEALRD